MKAYGASELRPSQVALATLGLVDCPAPSEMEADDFETSCAYADAVFGFRDSWQIRREPLWATRLKERLVQRGRRSDS